MSRNALLAVLALDLLVAASSAYVLLDRVKKSFEPAPMAAAIHELPLQLPAAAQKPPPPQKPAPKAPVKTSPVPPKKKALKRNVLFHFRDPRAKKVSVIGTFNNWSPQPMKKDASHKWSITLSIEEGRHAYNFVVDGKTIRDPSAKQSEKVPGRRIPSSVLSLEKKT